MAFLQNIFSILACKTCYRFTLAALLICGLLPSAAHALGVMEPELKSYINEPLLVEIPLLLTIREENVDIVIQQLEGKNKNINNWVPDLEFSLINDVDDSFSILATTKLPVNEPIVHFTISIDTGFNWIQREMSFLLDPKPILSLAKQASRKTGPRVVLKPGQARLQRGTPAPSQATTPIITADTSSYTVQSGDSLSLIAQSFRHTRNVSANQAMVSIYQANPDAFINEDINKIKSHHTIMIPDESGMKKLSAAEAGRVFNQLLSAHPMPARSDEQPTALPADRSAEVTQSNIESIDTGKPVTKDNKSKKLSDTVGIPTDQEYQLTLSPKNADVSQRTVNENSGEVVYKAKETAASKAASPDPKVREAMRSSVIDMEEQLATLRQEVKKLRQTLQGNKNLLALKSENRLQSPPVDQQVNNVATEASPGESTGSIEADAIQPGETESDYNFLRLFIEFLVFIAAGGFIGYVIAIRKKQADYDEELEPVEDFTPAYAPTATQASPNIPDIIDKPLSNPVFEDTQDGIEVTVEDYDDSIDFTHPELEPEKVTEPPPEEINPEYILQEANLSIAFSDLDNAYHLLTKLINHDPRNAEYRLLALGVLEDLLKEEEFLYHANHLAKITNKSMGSEWQAALEIGRHFLPDHPLFILPKPKPQSDPGTKKPNWYDNTSVPGTPAVQNTVVLDTRKALAEHERRLKEKAEKEKEELSAAPAENRIDDDQEVSLDLDLDLILDIDNAGDGTKANKEDRPFRLNLEETPTPNDSESATEEYSIDDPVSADTMSDSRNDEGLSINGRSEPETTANRTTGNAIDKGNVIEFTKTESNAAQDSKDELAKELEENLSPEALAAMAEFAVIEGITLDEDLLHFDERLEQNKKEDKEKEVDKTILIKRD